MNSVELLTVFKALMPLITGFLIAIVTWLFKTVLKKQDKADAREDKKELQCELKELRKKYEELITVLYRNMASKEDMNMLRDKVDKLSSTLLAYLKQGDSNER